MATENDIAMRDDRKAKDDELELRSDDALYETEKIDKGKGRILPGFSTGNVHDMADSKTKIPPNVSDEQQQIESEAPLPPANPPGADPRESAARRMAFGRNDVSDITTTITTTTPGCHLPNALELLSRHRATLQPEVAAIALSDHQRHPSRGMELELHLRDQITEIAMISEDRWWGKNPRGEVGHFPASYVQLPPFFGPISTAADGSAGPSMDTPILPCGYEFRSTSTGDLRIMPIAEPDEVQNDTEAESRPVDDGAPIDASQSSSNVRPVREENRDRSGEAATGRDSSSEVFCRELASHLSPELGQYGQDFICSLDYLNKVIALAKKEYGEDYDTSFFPVAYILRPWPRVCLELDEERRAFTKAMQCMPEIAALLFPELAVREGQDPHPLASPAIRMNQMQRDAKFAHFISENCGPGIRHLLFSHWPPWRRKVEKVINMYDYSPQFRTTLSFSAGDLMNFKADKDFSPNIFVPCNLDWLIIGAMGFKFNIDPKFFVHYCSRLVFSVRPDSHELNWADSPLLVAQRLHTCAKFVWEGYCRLPVGIDGSWGTFRSVTSCYVLDGGRNLLLSKGKYTYIRHRYPREPQIKAHEVKTFLARSGIPIGMKSLEIFENGPYYHLPSLFLETSLLSKRDAAVSDIFPLTDAGIYSIVRHIDLLFKEYVPADADAGDVLEAIFNNFGFSLALSSWKESLRRLDKEVAEIEQGDIIASTDKTFEELHAARLKLAYFSFEVHELQEKHLQIVGSMTTSKEDFSALLRRATQIAERLNNLFQVIMGTNSLKEARESVKLAERATFLTFITLIYLPLSLATGVFGMNIKEINKENIPTWRACAVMAGVLLGVTGVLVIIALYRSLLRRVTLWLKAVRRRTLSFVIGCDERKTVWRIRHKIFGYGVNERIDRIMDRLAAINERNSKG